jgi:hypothetical protein
MLIRTHPDFLFYPWRTLPMARKHRAMLKPEVQGLWEIIVKNGKD